MLPGSFSIVSGNICKFGFNDERVWLYMYSYSVFDSWPFDVYVPPTFANVNFMFAGRPSSFAMYDESPRESIVSFDFISAVMRLLLFFMNP